MARSLEASLILCLSLICAARSSSALAVCPRSGPAFPIDETRSVCPIWIERSSPLEVNGEFLDKALIRGGKNAYNSVFFYASWCPFSFRTRPTFDALNSMFPQIRHLAIEESSALPSVFSRYGVHSFPSILLMNRTTLVRYRGSKDLHSLVQFYKKVTGLEPVTHFSVDQPAVVGDERPWNCSLRKFLAREPCLAFSVLFILLRVSLYLFPGMLSWFKLLWVSCVRQFHMGIFGGSSQLLDRALHIIDMKKLWNQVRLCNKARNFQKGANNARAWASSLTSVSLESSSSRLSTSDS